MKHFFFTFLFLIFTSCYAFSQIKRRDNFPTEDSYKKEKNKYQYVEFNSPLFKYDTNLVSVFILKNKDKVIGRIKTIYAKNALKLMARAYEGFFIKVEKNDKITTVDIKIDSIDTAYIAAGEIDKYPNMISGADLDLDLPNSISYVQIRNISTDDDDDEKSKFVVLVNPMFSKKIKVYVSPSTAIVSVNNGSPFYRKVTVEYQGKSYLMTRKNYKEISSILFQECGERFKNYRTGYMSYENLADQVFSFDNNNCN